MAVSTLTVLYAVFDLGEFFGSFAVLDDVSSVLRFLIHPNTPLLKGLLALRNSTGN